MRKADDAIIDATISMVLFRETMSQGLAIKGDESMSENTEYVDCFDFIMFREWLANELADAKKLRVDE